VGIIVFILHLAYSLKIYNMKGNQLSSHQLHPSALLCLEKLKNTLILKEYGKGTIRNYVQVQ
jgi:hypothetical protein